MKKIQSFIDKHQMFTKRDLVLVAVSGGSDSLGTLLLLKTMGYKVHAVGVNHGLRPEAKEEMLFVDSVCKKFGIPFASLTISMDASRNVQAVAREKRYAAMLEVKEAVGAKALVVGHTLNDQVETYLMAIMRGKGTHAAGIKPVREDGVMRPLLDVTRQDIRDFLVKNNVTWIEDPSNENPKYERVRVRNICTSFYSVDNLFLQHMGEHAETLADMHQLVVEKATHVYTKALHKGQLDLSILKKERQCVQDQVLAIFLGKNPGRNLLKEFRKAVEAGRGQVRLSEGKLFVVAKGFAFIDTPVGPPTKEVSTSVTLPYRSDYVPTSQNEGYVKVRLIPKDYKPKDVSTND